MGLKCYTCNQRPFGLFMKTSSRGRISFRLSVAFVHGPSFFLGLGVTFLGYCVFPLDSLRLWRQGPGFLPRSRGPFNYHLPRTCLLSPINFYNARAFNCDCAGSSKTNCLHSAPHSCSSFQLFEQAEGCKLRVLLRRDASLSQSEQDFYFHLCRPKDGLMQLFSLADDVFCSSTVPSTEKIVQQMSHEIFFWLKYRTIPLPRKTV